MYIFCIQVRSQTLLGLIDADKDKLLPMLQKASKLLDSQHLVVLVSKEFQKSTSLAIVKYLVPNQDFIIINDPSVVSHVSRKKGTIFVLEDFAGKYQYNIKKAQDCLNLLIIVLMPLVKDRHIKVIVTTSEDSLQAMKENEAGLAKELERCELQIGDGVEVGKNTSDMFSKFVKILYSTMVHSVKHVGEVDKTHG